MRERPSREAFAVSGSFTLEPSTFIQVHPRSVWNHLRVSVIGSSILRIHALFLDVDFCGRAPACNECCLILESSMNRSGCSVEVTQRATMERWSAGGGRHFVQVLGLCVSIWLIAGVAASADADPVPKPWPLQFHAQMYQNRTGALSMVDLWYDYPNGRNLNLIQKQLGSVTHDVEYTNGTSYYYDLKAGTCREVHFSVGILRPDWLNDATYIGVEEIDGFKCNVWEKVEFIRYYEDIESRRPVSWYFFTSGMDLHIMTFEEGNVLDDQKWQAPLSCFQKTTASASATLTASKDNDPIRKGLLSKASLGGRKDLFQKAHFSL